MSDVAIRVEGLSKAYIISHQAGGHHQYRTLREDLVNLVKAPFNRSDGASRKETVWALRDVSFEVKRGEVLGVIGRNGAGKSTLLKLLSRITRPTEGYADVYGRVGSLLEVGTGFHPELTGRENVFLSGAVLGMTRAEVRHKFDEIVAFAEIEKFLDTPVKRYSSGMYMRLAFAVAAHLDPNILLVDEVLAVGDAIFQKKCLGKMEDVAKQGRTVLFVSHNMMSIIALTQRCLWIDVGQLVRDASTTDVVATYQDAFYQNIQQGKNCAIDLTDAERYGTGKGRFESVKITPMSVDDTPQDVLHTGQDLRFDLVLVARDKVSSLNVDLIISDVLGYRLIRAGFEHGESLQLGQKAHISFRFKNVLLKPGRYLLALWTGQINVETMDGIPYAADFYVDVAPDNTVSLTSPGVYQCEYTHTIQIHEQAL